MLKVIVAERGQAEVYEADKLGERRVTVKTLKNDAARKHESALVRVAVAEGRPRAS
jgi:hypothetical protein